ncbi:MAG: mechanosensitive ion channel family protein [Fusobacteriota bacterium]
MEILFGREEPWILALIQMGTVIAVLFGTILMVKIIKKVMTKRMEKTRMDITQFNFLKHLVLGIVYFLGFLLAIYSIPSLRIISKSLFAGSGILAIVIGFASQQAFSNIVGGIFIALFKPFSIGDRLTLVSKNVMGIVEDITLRHTVIRTFENKRIVVPNSVISTETLENANIVDEKICKLFTMGISYDSDVDLAMKIMKEEILDHPKFYDNRTLEQKENDEDPVTIRLLDFGESSVNIRAWIWAQTPADAFVLGCDLNKKIKERFDEAGIEIPFPHRTVVMKK